VAITGYPGQQRNLVSKMKLPQHATAEIKAGRMKPAIIVMLRPSIVTGRDTECTDVPGGPHAGTFFSQDVPMAIESHYRTAPAPHGWGLLGNSTGGYCALRLAMLHSDRFSSAVAMSADYDAKQDRQTGDLYGGSPQVKQESDLMYRLTHFTAPPVRVMVTTSRKGEANYRATLRFAKLAKPPMHVTKLIRDSGGHNFETWQAEAPEALRFLGRNLSTDGRRPKPVTQEPTTPWQSSPPTASDLPPSISKVPRTARLAR
jgi:enterochelin esterase-like enzyme